MRDLGLTFEDLTSAVVYLRRYAAAVESKLYMNMSTPEAHAAIEEAERLADVLEAAAGKLDTVSPTDLG